MPKSAYSYADNPYPDVFKNAFLSADYVKRHLFRVRVYRRLDSWDTQCAMCGFYAYSPTWSVAMNVAATHMMMSSHKRLLRYGA